MLKPLFGCWIAVLLLMLEVHFPAASVSQRICCCIIALCHSSMILWKQMHGGKTNTLVIFFSLSKHCRHFNSSNLTQKSVLVPLLIPGRCCLCTHTNLTCFLWCAILQLYCHINWMQMSHDTCTFIYPLKGTIFCHNVSNLWGDS